MLGYLKGKILFKGDNFLILDVSGVGYKLLVSEKTLKNISKKKEIAEFFVWPYLKRETIELYACPNQEEFKVFEILEKMPGIGPKTALGLASLGSLEKLSKALEKDNKELGKIKGLGKKRIQRLMIEVLGELKKSPKQKFLKDDEALGGLIFLGFSRKDAVGALSKIPKKIKEPKEKIKEALKLLGN